MTSEEMLCREFVAAHAIEAAEVLEGLLAEERIPFLENIPPELGAQVLQLMAPSFGAGDLDQMDPVRASEILTRVPPDAASIVLRRMGEEKRVVILQNLPQEARQLIGNLLRYPENTAGALMEPKVFTLFEDQRVDEAITQISHNPEHVHYYIPVIDRQQILKGFVCIRELMCSGPESLVVTVTTTGMSQLLADSRREAILSHPGWQVFPDLPVVDARGRILGMLSYRILRHLESEVGEPASGRALSGASKALGELYWLGISAFVRGTSSILASDRRE